MSVTVKDVARCAGVSTATVSRVRNQSTVVTAATRTSVNSAIDLLGYRQDIHAVCLGRKRSMRRFLIGQAGIAARTRDRAGSAPLRTSEILGSNLDFLHLLARKCEALSCQIDEVSRELNFLIAIAEGRRL